MPTGDQIPYTTAMKHLAGTILSLSLVACGARSEGVLGERSNPQDPGTQSSGSPVCLGEPGAMVVLETQALGPFVVDGGNVFFNRLSGGFWKRPVQGGPATKLDDASWEVVGQSAQHLFGIPSDATSEIHILQVPKAGGAVQDLVTIDDFPGEVFPPSVAVDTGGTLWFSSGNLKSPRGLWRKSPGKPMELVVSEILNAFPFFLNGQTYFYHGSDMLRDLGRVEEDGSITKVLSDFPPGCYSIPRNQEVFCEVNRDIIRLDLSKEKLVREVIYDRPEDTGEIYSSQLLLSPVVDDKYIYFGENFSNSSPDPGASPAEGWKISRIPRQGGNVEEVATGGKGEELWAIAEDGCHLYWTSNTNLVRMRKR